jgi:hypothetical protein
VVLLIVWWDLLCAGQMEHLMANDDIVIDRALCRADKDTAGLRAVGQHVAASKAAWTKLGKMFIVSQRQQYGHRKCWNCK